MGALSRAFSTMALAAAAIPADVLALVGDEPVDGFRGNGGGARSGSELSHLRLIAVSKVMFECRQPYRGRTVWRAPTPVLTWLPNKAIVLTWARLLGHRWC